MMKGSGAWGEIASVGVYDHVDNDDDDDYDDYGDGENDEKHQPCVIGVERVRLSKTLFPIGPPKSKPYLILNIRCSSCI